MNNIINKLKKWKSQKPKKKKYKIKFSKIIILDSKKLFNSNKNNLSNFYYNLNMFLIIFFYNIFWFYNGYYCFL